MTFTKDFDTVLKMKFKQMNVRIIYDFDDVAKNIDNTDPTIVKNELEDAATRYLDELSYKNETYVLAGYPVLYAKAFMGTRNIRFTFTPLSLTENNTQPLNGLKYPPGVRGGFGVPPVNPLVTRPAQPWMNNPNPNPMPHKYTHSPDPFNGHTEY